MIDDDVNGHLGGEKIEYERVHGKYECGEKNKSSKKVLDLEPSYKLIIINTYLRKK